jgi:uncharacterized membrane protein YphA (DoxX/SURF4 family)
VSSRLLTPTPLPRADRPRPSSRWLWAGSVARCALAVVWLVAGASKVSDLEHSGRVINAYRILPYDLAEMVGFALPFVEIAIGALLLLGCATRLLAGLSAALLVAFIIGIVWVWSHGYRIDCGCFGGGGDLAADQSPTYLVDLVRDTGLLLLALGLLARPRSWLTIDNWLRGEAQLPARREN